MQRLRLQSESGLTLIELLVVRAIIGILAAIAIPQFSAYRKRGYEAQVKSDLRNAATAEEAYFASTPPSVYKIGGGTSRERAWFDETTGRTINAAIDSTSGTLVRTEKHVYGSGCE